MWKALKKKKYKVTTFDPKLKNYNLINKKKIDVIFNALHGKDGEDGVAQSYFEYLRIPYTHSGVISSHNAMNKIISKKIFIENNILTPKYFNLSKNDYQKTSLKKIFNKGKFKFPLVIKPINEGSSLGVKIVKNFLNFKKFINYLFKRYNQLICEQFIGGQEIQASVINDKPLGARTDPKNFYDYKAKYTKSLKQNSYACKTKKKKIFGGVKRGLRASSTWMQRCCRSALNFIKINFSFRN